MIHSSMARMWSNKHKTHWQRGKEQIVAYFNSNPIALAHMLEHTMFGLAIKDVMGIELWEWDVDLHQLAGILELIEKYEEETKS